MKNRRQRAKQVRQRKVALLAAYSRANTVRNSTIPKIDKHMKVYKDGNGEWDIPEEGFKQPKTLRKKYKKKYYFKGTNTIRKVISHPSDWDEFKDRTFRPNTSRAWYMEQVVQHKVAKWEKKNPCPIKDEKEQADIFEQEFMIPWKAKREMAIERIRDFVVSVYDKLHVVGNRVDYTKGTIVGKPVAKVKDSGGKGHNVTYPNLKETDKLYKDATKAATIAMNKDSTIIDCDLKNHKGDQKRPLVHAKRSQAKTQNLKQHRELKKAA